MNAGRLLDFLEKLGRWSDDAWALCKIEAPALGAVIRVPVKGMP